MLEKDNKKRLVYLTCGRIPTEKANGYQISKMCEAFAGEGVDVNLFFPYRMQHNKELKNITLFEYYSVAPVFTYQQFPILDIFILENILPAKLFGVLLVVYQYIWTFVAVLFLRITNRYNMYYTRDLPYALWLSVFRLRNIYEIHSIQKNLMPKLIRHIGKRARITCITSYLKKEIVAKGVAEEYVAVDPDAVDLKGFEDAESKETYRIKYNLPKGYIIGYVGRFNTLGMEKGIPELIKSLAILHAQGESSIYLLCVGGPMEQVVGYKRLAQELKISEDAIIFVDRVPNKEVKEWISSCDVVTIPWTWNEFSAYYTSPMKMFEYMASGVPIISSDLPALRDVLTHEKNALLVEPSNVNALAEAIIRCKDNSGFSMSLAERAKEDVKRYTWEKRAKKILSWYESI